MAEDSRLEGVHLVYLASLDRADVMARSIASIVQKVAEASVADGRPIDWSTLSVRVESHSDGHPRIHVRAWGVPGEAHHKPSDVLNRSVEGVMRKLWREKGAPRQRQPRSNHDQGGAVDG